MLLKQVPQQIKLMLVNGRLSEKSQHHYQQISWLITPLLNHFDRVLTQSQENRPENIRKRRTTRTKPRPVQRSIRTTVLGSAPTNQRSSNKPPITSVEPNISQDTPNSYLAIDVLAAAQRHPFSYRT